MILEGLQETIAGYLKRDEDPLGVIMGQTEAKKAILASILAGHHVLIEGPREWERRPWPVIWLQSSRL